LNERIHTLAYEIKNGKFQKTSQYRIAADSLFQQYVLVVINLFEYSLGVHGEVDRGQGKGKKIIPIGKMWTVKVS
jgi:hypothetical protein